MSINELLAELSTLGVSRVTLSMSQNGPGALCDQEVDSPNGMTKFQHYGTGADAESAALEVLRRARLGWNLKAPSLVPGVK